MAPQAQAMQTPFRWPLVASLQNRDNTLRRDAKILNAYAELNPQTKEWEVQKRPGIGDKIYTSNNQPGYGMFSWEWSYGNIALYVNSGSTIYKNGAIFGTITSLGTMHFQPLLSNPGSLFMSNGTYHYWTLGAVLFDITATINALTTLGWAKGIAYLDGTTYMMTLDCKIYGTANEDDVTVWDPLNMIQAQDTPGWGIALTRHLSYILAIKRWNTEVFEDTGNPTGSPLSAVKGARIDYGCTDANTIQSIDDTLIWVASNQASQIQVVRLDQLQATVISTPNVERLLKGTLISPFNSMTLKIGGHRFYVLTSYQNNVTLVYDLDTGLWFVWTDSSGNFWPYAHRSFSSLGVPLIQHYSTGTVYPIGEDYEYASDNGVLFPVDIYTVRWDGGVDRTKVVPQLRFNTDQTAGSVLNVRFSDDDYASWTNFQNVDLSLPRPIIGPQGSFYKRAYHLRHMKNTPFRITSMDMPMDLGVL